MRVHRGRPQHKKPRCHTIHLQHLPDICKATLLLNYYLVGRQLLQQTRGAPMGSPASPAICDMVVVVCEQSWTHTYRAITCNVKHTTPHQFTLSGHFATRYVDNRLSLTPSATQHFTHFRQFSPTSTAHPFSSRRNPATFSASLLTPTPTARATKPPTASQTLCCHLTQLHRPPCSRAVCKPVPFWQRGLLH